MEVTYYEDPACSWCWAFEPVATAFAFEFRSVVSVRHVMGGLRDRPVADAGFAVQQWRTAEALSGMPFDTGIWEKRPIETTFTACRAVKAASLLDPAASVRLLRRLREGFFAERVPIDDVEEVLRLAVEAGLLREALLENLESGRAEEIFARDRVEAAQAGFGFPTISIQTKKLDAPVLLEGAVDYSDLLDTLFTLGIAQRKRRRFKDSMEDWAALFKIHRRLTCAEIRLVTGIDKAALDGRLRELNVRRSGVFYELGEPIRAKGVASPAPRRKESSAGEQDSRCAPSEPPPEGSEAPVPSVAIAPEIAAAHTPPGGEIGGSGAGGATR